MRLPRNAVPEKKRGVKSDQLADEKDAGPSEGVEIALSKASGAFFVCRSAAKGHSDPLALRISFVSACQSLSYQHAQLLQPVTLGHPYRCRQHHQEAEH